MVKKTCARVHLSYMFIYYLIDTHHRIAFVVLYAVGIEEEVPMRSRDDDDDHCQTATNNL